MTGKISLTASMRSNLLSLQNISRQVDSTQNKLATGNKVNSAIDNPSSYYTARSLTNRANDLDALLDSMGQAVNTIKTATTALETGATFLEQAAAIADQALENTTQAGAVVSRKSTEELEAEGYRVVSNAADLQAAIANGAKIALGGDITLDSTLKIMASNVSIDGNGYTLKYTSATSRESVIAINGRSSSVDIKNLSINASGNRVYGIMVTGGSLTIDNIMGIKVSGTGAQKLVNGNADIYDGITNTKAMLEQLGDKALAASAANQFYIGDKNGTFGQGKWYLPSIGELMEMFGTNLSQMTKGNGSSGAIGNNAAKIDAALATLEGKGAAANSLTKGYANYYWTSSEANYDYSWKFNLGNGYRTNDYKYDNVYVRPTKLLENIYNPLDKDTIAPKLGDVMYADKTYGSADDYDGSKQAVGIVGSVGNDGSVKIISLKDLTFSSSSSAGNFDPDNPYGGSESRTHWTTDDKVHEDLVDVPDYLNANLYYVARIIGTITVSNIPFSAGGGDSGNIGVDSSYTERFNNVLNQYDMLINDASYKGVNLLKSQTLNVRFNEDGSSDLNVAGKDMISGALGLNTADWNNMNDIAQSLKEIANALNTIRAFTSELGNNYSIITSRQDFTDNLINILTEGADKLTLADMNEESANMLALQTRQQLAVNSLSLASQSAQSILKLF